MQFLRATFCDTACVLQSNCKRSVFVTVPSGGLLAHGAARKTGGAAAVPAAGSTTLVAAVARPAHRLLDQRRLGTIC